MNHFYTLLSVTVAMLMGAAPAMLADTELLYETFDDDTHFPDGATVPDGWASDGDDALARWEGSYVGTPAHSGSYVFGALTHYAPRDNRVYLPPLSLKAGQECTLSFSIITPQTPAMPPAKSYTVTVTAGTAQTPEAQTLELGALEQYKSADAWEDQRFTFTPQADGDYCLCVRVQTSVPSVGWIFLDDVTVTVADTDPDPQPGEHQTEPLPYAQSFDNENHDYDGTTTLPRGWLSTGSLPFITANSDAMKARTGEYYAVTAENDVQRDEALYSPFFDMAAGTTYDISFYLWMPGHDFQGVLRATDMVVNIGQDQTPQAQDTELYEVSAASIPGWQKIEAEFTPQESGQYTVGMFIMSSDMDYASYCGMVGVEDFTVMARGDIQRPVVDFTVTAWNNVMDGTLVAFQGQPVQMANLTTGADSYAWTVALPTGAVIEESADRDPAFLIPDTGNYTVTLTATNAGGSRTASRTLTIVVKERGVNEPQVCLTEYNIADDAILYTHDQMPRWDTDPMFDYVSGFNHYYHSYAQRYDLPEDQTLAVSSLSTWLVAYNRYMDQDAASRNHPFSISVLGETNGLPDPAKCFGTVQTTIVDAFGNLGCGYERPKQWGFDFAALGSKPIAVHGPFYVVFNYDQDMPLTSPVEVLERSYVALAMVRHKSGANSIYVLPEAAPEGSFAVADGQHWEPLDRLDASKGGHGLYMVLWGERNPSEAGMPQEAIGPDGTTAWAVRVSPDGTLTVSGTSQGQTLRVHAMDGRCAATAPAADGSTSVSVAGLAPGVYAVTCGSRAAKVAIAR